MRQSELEPESNLAFHDFSVSNSAPKLIVRRRIKMAGDRDLFRFLGSMTYVSHSGEQPMSIMWRLLKPMPLDVFRIARVAAGA